MKYLWKIGGEAGFGIMTTGVTFSKIASRSGYHVFDYNEYPSLIRGGHNTYEVLFSDDEVFASQRQVDLLVCLNKDTYALHKRRLAQSSIVVYDSDEFEFENDELGFEVIKIAVPFHKWLKENTAQYMMANTIAQGVTLGILDGDMTFLYDIIEKEFARKGKEIVEFNKKFAEMGYSHIKQNYSQHIKSHLARKDPKEQLVLSGNDSFSLGAVAADCRLYSAYPMTPSSQVLAILAGWQAKTGMVVRHAEDEIAVINTAIGASFGGVRSAVGTSGGGFALMVESVSYAGVTEIPLVIFLGMRPGPATGMPTWTEQGDLLFTAHAGHGEFPKIVLAPGDMQEVLELTMDAFDLADIYQTPVIVVSDKFLCEAHNSIDKKIVEDTLRNYKIQRGKTIHEAKEKPYLRYKITDDGISDRLIPGQKDVYYQSNSYEHDETGHTSEDSAVRIAQVDKRNRKWLTYMQTHYKGPQIIGDLDEASIVFVSWGANKGPIRDAQAILKVKGVSTALIHFTHVYPISTSGLPHFTLNKRYVLIENNSHAQFGRLLREETGIEIKEKLLKYDGRPFWPEEIVDYVLKV